MASDCLPRVTPCRAPQFNELLPDELPEDDDELLEFPQLEWS